MFAGMPGIKLERGKPYVKANPFTADTIAIIVGFTGDLKGQAVYGFRSDYAKMLAGAMCGGAEITEFDELATSAIGELCNMISGSSATYLNETMGYKLNITPPTVMIGESMQVFIKPPILCIPFNADFEINYSLS